MLQMLALLAGGLAVARTLGALLDGGLSGYTGGPLALEWGSLAIAVLLLRPR